MNANHLWVICGIEDCILADVDYVGSIASRGQSVSWCYFIWAPVAISHKALNVHSPPCHCHCSDTISVLVGCLQRWGLWMQVLYEQSVEEKPYPDSCGYLWFYPSSLRGQYVIWPVYAWAPVEAMWIAGSELALTGNHLLLVSYTPLIFSVMRKWGFHNLHLAGFSDQNLKYRRAYKNLC